MQVGITHCVYVFNMCELHNYVEIAHLAVFKFMTYRNNVYLGIGIPIFKFSLIECKIKTVYSTLTNIGPNHLPIAIAIASIGNVANRLAMPPLRTKPFNI